MYSLRDNDQYTAVINERHHKRLRGYLEDAEQRSCRIIPLNPRMRTQQRHGQDSAHVDCLSGDRRAVHGRGNLRAAVTDPHLQGLRRDHRLSPTRVLWLPTTLALTRAKRRRSCIAPPLVACASTM